MGCLVQHELSSHIYENAQSVLTKPACALQCLMSSYHSVSICVCVCVSMNKIPRKVDIMRIVSFPFYPGKR